MVEPTAKFEEVKIRLREPIGDLEEVSGLLGIPQWWPTGSRVSVVLAHGSGRSYQDPLLEHVHRELTERGYMTLRFNFPFAELGRRRVNDIRVLVQTYRSAIAMLGRDSTAAPAHLFLGGKGLGAKVAVQLATQRLRIDGLFAFGFPLHRAGKPDQIEAGDLFRIVSPMLFLQGTRDRWCDLGALDRTLAGIGAPTALHVVEEADQHFKAPKRSGRTEDEVRAELIAKLDAWIQKTIGGS